MPKWVVASQLQAKAVMTRANPAKAGRQICDPLASSSPLPENLNVSYASNSTCKSARGAYIGGIVRARNLFGC